MADASQADPELVRVAVDLYGVPPARFTAQRTAAVRAARAAGDRDLARAVGALRKPSAAASAVNLLLRHHPEDVARLLELGVRLREAQSALAGADLRALHADQQGVLATVVPTALALAADGGSGRPAAAARAQVEATLRAAMGDPDAAGAVATGLLVRDLFSSGFEPVDVAGATAVPGAPPLAGAPVRRTPLREVVAPEAPTAEPAGDPPRRRRGRLIAAEEPERSVAGEVQPARGHAGAGHAGAGRGGAGPVESGRESRAGRAPVDGRAERTVGRDVARVSGGGRRARRERERQAERPPGPGRAQREREAGRRREVARRAAEEDATLARAAVTADREARDAADARVDAADRRDHELAGVVESTRTEIARLREVLAAAEREARDVGLELRRARSARTAAQRALERSEARLRAAERARDET
ncbi:hypothetical protein [Cellulomonas sp. C5510]|uniref:hypothetical protein n=1 Tax=Cellulomonas sp. C5510 TaxID=2871170 RepID=UPI001C96CAE3|nr:hypothetical protein [Cellulomonas sp. C5510]QZN87197.1 hypothetical protein K5O09_08940 [Cellulomonas sp. C5510]